MNINIFYLKYSYDVIYIYIPLIIIPLFLTSYLYLTNYY